MTLTGRDDERRDSQDKFRRTCLAPSVMSLPVDKRRFASSLIVYCLCLCARDKIRDP